VGGNEEKGKLPIPLKVTLVFTNRIGRSNLSRGWASWWPRVHTRKLLGLQFACVSIKMQVAAVFLSQGKVSPRAGRPKSRWGNCRACTSRPEREYSGQLPKARYAVFQGFTITCCRYISVICCLPGSLLLLLFLLFLLLLLLVFLFPTIH